MTGGSYGNNEVLNWLLGTKTNINQVLDNLQFRKDIALANNISAKLNFSSEEELQKSIKQYIFYCKKESAAQHFLIFSRETISIILLLGKNCDDGSNILKLIFENLITYLPDIRIDSLHAKIEELCVFLHKKSKLSITLQEKVNNLLVDTSFKVFSVITNQKFEGNIYKFDELSAYLIKFWSKFLKNGQKSNSLLIYLNPKRNDNTKSHLLSLMFHPLLQFKNIEVLDFFLKLTECYTIFESYQNIINDIFSFLSDNLLQSNKKLFEWMTRVLFGSLINYSNEWLQTDTVSETFKHEKEPVFQTKNFEEAFEKLKIFLTHILQASSHREIAIKNIIVALSRFGNLLFTSLRNVLLVSPIIELIVFLCDEEKSCQIYEKYLLKNLYDWLTITKILIFIDFKNNRKFSKTFSTNIIVCLQLSMKLIDKTAYPGKNLILQDNLLEEITFEEEHNICDESDDDSATNVLCTFASTQKEFVSQHWYYCYTCKFTPFILHNFYS